MGTGDGISTGSWSVCRGRPSRFSAAARAAIVPALAAAMAISSTDGDFLTEAAAGVGSGPKAGVGSGIERGAATRTGSGIIIGAGAEAEAGCCIGAAGLTGSVNGFSGSWKGFSTGVDLLLIGTA